MEELLVYLILSYEKIITYLDSFLCRWLINICRRRTSMFSL